MANIGGEASSSGGGLCPFLGHFSTPALQMAFRAAFGVPDDVQVSLVGQRVEGVAAVQHREGMLLIPLMAVFEGESVSLFIPSWLAFFRSSAQPRACSQ